ncbi:MAG: hypothetical protein AAB262_03845, partial [Elusimicrobiota bacterium]
MIDLFGLKKQTTETPSLDVVSNPVPETPRGSHRLWAFLLILNSVFIIVFGGAVAAKLYQYWKAPAAIPVAIARRHPVTQPLKPPEPAKTAEPPKAPEPEKPAAKPEPEISRHADTPRPP